MQDCESSSSSVLRLTLLVVGGVGNSWRGSSSSVLRLTLLVVGGVGNRLEGKVSPASESPSA